MSHTHRTVCTRVHFQWIMCACVWSTTIGDHASNEVKEVGWPAERAILGRVWGADSRCESSTEVHIQTSDTPSHRTGRERRGQLVLGDRFVHHVCQTRRPWTGRQTGTITAVSSFIKLLMWLGDTSKDREICPVYILLPDIKENTHTDTCPHCSTEWRRPPKHLFADDNQIFCLA